MPKVTTMDYSPRTEHIGPLNQVWRIVTLVTNVLVAWTIFYYSTGTYIPTGSGASVWFLASTAHWLLTLLAAPFFLPPRDSLSTSIAVVLLLAPIDLSGVSDFRGPLVALNALAIALAVAAGLTALIAIFNQTGHIGKVAYRLSGALGRGELLFTPAVIISAIGFYQGATGSMVTILVFWTLMTTMRPIEYVITLIQYVRSLSSRSAQADLSGRIVRIDDPNIVRVALASGVSNWESTAVHAAYLPNGKMNYILPLFTQLHNEDMLGIGLCYPAQQDSSGMARDGSVYAVSETQLIAEITQGLSGEVGVNTIVGIVIERSSISTLRFHVVRGVGLEEGMVVFGLIRGKKVYYQILDANTDEESFQQSPFGMHVVSAVQLGCYDPINGFEKFPWLPEMNQPLFLTPSESDREQQVSEGEFLIGDVPATPFGLPVVLDDLIEYHTAVLGITGTGKTELTFDIIRHALTRDAKVFCVDFTGEYRARLADCNPRAIGLDVEQGSELADHLFAVETGEYGAKAEKAALQNLLDAIKPQIADTVEAFVTDPEQHLGIFELAEITNTKATLRTTEMYLSSIMDWAKRNRKAEKILIVLEEAHTIIPEAFGSGFDSETQWVVGRIGQIALQGRKYGVGLLLVSQRTALVSKTVLSQCNTYFTHSLVDKTSLEYLAGVYSAEHVRAIPNLRFLEFIAQGKAVKSDRPIIVRRQFDRQKLSASRALDTQHNRLLT